MKKSNYYLFAGVTVLILALFSVRRENSDGIVPATDAVNLSPDPENDNTSESQNTRFESVSQREDYFHNSGSNYQQPQIQQNDIGFEGQFLDDSDCQEQGTSARPTRRVRNRRNGSPYDRSYPSKRPLNYDEPKAIRPSQYHAYNRSAHQPPYQIGSGTEPQNPLLMNTAIAQQAVVESPSYQDSGRWRPGVQSTSGQQGYPGFSAVAPGQEYFDYQRRMVNRVAGVYQDAIQVETQDPFSPSELPVDQPPAPNIDQPLQLANPLASSLGQGNAGQVREDGMAFGNGGLGSSVQQGVGGLRQSAPQPMVPLDQIPRDQVPVPNPNSLSLQNPGGNVGPPNGFPQDGQGSIQQGQDFGGNTGNYGNQPSLQPYSQNPMQPYPADTMLVPNTNQGCAPGTGSGYGSYFNDPGAFPDGTSGGGLWAESGCNSAGPGGDYFAGGSTGCDDPAFGNAFSRRPRRYFANESQFGQPYFGDGNPGLNVQLGGLQQIRTISYDLGYANQLQFGFESVQGPGFRFDYMDLDARSNLLSESVGGGVTNITADVLSTHNFGDRVDVSHRVDIENYRPEFFKRIYFPVSTLTGGFGLEHLYVRQFKEFSLIPHGSHAASDSVQLTRSFRGTGPTISLDYYRPVGHTSFAVVGGFRGSALFGNNQSDVFRHNVHQTTFKSDRTVTVFNAYLGTEWGRMIGRCQDKRLFLRGTVGGNFLAIDRSREE